MVLEELAKYKKVLILGYGTEGQSIEKYLRGKFPALTIGIADQKDGPDYLEKQKDYELAIKSPGVNKKLMTIPHTTPTNIFFANAKAPIIGVTGTKGKSTTTSLIHAMLLAGGYDARLCGNIGLPMIDELDKPVTEKTVYVVELSSYQLDDIEYSPHVSVILNLFPEHMDYHGGFDAYKEAKKNIVARAGEGDYFVFNVNYPELIELSKTTKAKPVEIVEILPFRRDIIPLQGEHNVFNVRAAYTVAQLFNVPYETVVEAVKNFKPLRHRLEQIGNFKGRLFYDDAISTTPESTMQAIHALDNIGTIFLGGTDRGYDFSGLANLIVSRGIKNIVLFPESGAKIKEELLKLSSDFNFFETRDMEEAVKFGYANTPFGSICLLSCASPSYSVWKNFEEKGDKFKEFVIKYG